MCSIIAYLGNYDNELMQKVFVNSKIRGLHSFGYSFYNNNKINTLKFLSFDDFINSINKTKPNLFIAHFRYSTSGDYLQMENNQPIEENNIAIAFNGVISQKNKEEIEKEYSIKLLADNDGFILLNKYTETEFITSKKISFAMVGLKDNKIIAIRNNKRPMYISDNENYKLITSTKDIMKRSGVLNFQQAKELKLYEFERSNN